MTDEIEHRPAWQMANGKPKPEWKLSLNPPIGDTKFLLLQEPRLKALRKALKKLVMTADGETPTAESGIESSIELLSQVTGVSIEVLDELPQSVFVEASTYLKSFSD